MIMTDIYVAALDKTYDFRLSEDAQISAILDEIAGILAREVMEQLPKGQFALCSYENASILPADSTLRECGIGNGSRLLFV